MKNRRAIGRRFYRLALTAFLCVLLGACKQTERVLTPTYLPGNVRVWQEVVAASVEDRGVQGGNADGGGVLVVLRDSSILEEYLGKICIARLPIIQKGNRVIVFHPYSPEYKLAELTIRENGDLVNQAGTVFPAIRSLPPEVVKMEEGIMRNYDPGYKTCRVLCRYTHRMLCLPKFIDRICCFWYPE